MGKYYAVRVGRKTGVFNTWEECKKQVWQYPGADFKSFSNPEDVNTYMHFSEIVKRRKEFIQTHKDTKRPLHSVGTYAFVDGSFNVDTGIYGYGGFLVHKKRFYLLIGRGCDAELVSMRNVTGEILGAQAAVQKALELNACSLSLFYDYSGIAAWAQGIWTPTRRGTIAYTEFMQSSTVPVSFEKVTAHTGIHGNEYADVLAKYAVGNRLSKGQLALLKEFVHLSGIQIPNIPVKTKRETIERHERMVRNETYI